jgi:hypothetical protein
LIFLIIFRYTSSPESRLSFGYNAQRTLFWFTHAKQPGYWESIKPLKVIHYSSSPKPCKALQFIIISIEDMFDHIIILHFHFFIFSLGEVSPSAGGTLGELEWKWWKLYMGM